MKRKITVLASIFIMTMILFTGSAFAIEKFDYDEATYVIDEVKLKTDALGEEVEFIAMDKNHNYIFMSLTNEKMYQVNENKCTVMSTQEILDFMNSRYYIYNFVEDDLNIYQEKMPEYVDRMGYIVTEDKVVDSNKKYFKKIENKNGGYKFEIIENPDLANGTYLEAVFLILPESAIIDNNITYYKEVEGVYTKVENPVAEEVLNYKVIDNLEDYVSVTKIGELTQEVYDIVFLKENLSTYTFYNEESKEVFFAIDYQDSNKSAIYKSDGTKVKEFDGMMLMQPLGNNFFIVAKCDENWERIDDKVIIIDTQGNTVLESENIPYFESLNYDEYTTYLKNTEVSGFYNIYEYKLLSEDNQKYYGKDLQIKTSGELNRLSSVKVNGTELDASNYTKESGSTIVTLKNDYLKTLALGTYSLEIGYVDGTKIETKFVIDKIYSSDTEDEKDKDKDNISETTEGIINEAKDQSDKDNIQSENNNINNDLTNNNNTNSVYNPQTGDNIVLYILILVVSSIGIIITTLKFKEQ